MERDEGGDEEMSKKERGREKEKKTCILASPFSFVIIILN